MVPLLIVLCPTFGGENGAYMATAIALASDIRGSAVTTGVYAKNKKIDLRHGWLMAVCIIGMCTVGSIAAYFTHQNVLGGFSLIFALRSVSAFLIYTGLFFCFTASQNFGSNKKEKGRWKNKDNLIKAIDSNANN